MKGSAVPWTLLSTALAALALVPGALAPGALAGQEVAVVAREAYFRAVGDHFQVSAQEVAIVGDWDLQPDEVPVVLFLARMAGVSPDALVGLRRSGRAWMDISDRFGLDAGAFHLPLPEGAPLGGLDRAFGEFRGRPAREWNRIRLTDAEIVALVNLRVLSAQAGTSPLQILRSREETGSFPAAYLRLRGG